MKNTTTNLLDHDAVKGKLRKLARLDFTDVKMKLMMEVPEGKEWSQSQADEAEKWYRRFLHLIIKYPEHAPVPNGPVDIFWHQHILDTQAYIRDCEEVFEGYLHHYPYFGLKDDATELMMSFEVTKQLCKMEFGEDYTSMMRDNTDDSELGISKSWSCAPVAACHNIIPSNTGRENLKLIQ